MRMRTARIGIGTMLLAMVGVMTTAVGVADADKKTKAVVGQMAPDFALHDLDGQEFSLQEIVGEGHVVVLEWFNPDCPFVQKHHKHNSTMKNLAASFAEQGVVWVAINSGAPGKQGAGIERNRKAVTDYSIAYPLLLDESGEVGRLYGATTSPGMYVIDTEGVLRYAGAIDNNPSARTMGDVNYVSEALDAVLAGSEVMVAQTKSYGCSVKY